MEQRKKALNQAMRDARRERELTQSELAHQAGCQQSAISMFEAGRQDALRQDKIERIAEILGLDLESFASEVAPLRPVADLHKYCPIDECPANVPYVVIGRLSFWCETFYAPANEKTRCPYCGEILEHQCPNPECCAPLTPGGFCMQCGTPYVRSAHEQDPDPTDWADDQREVLRELRILIQPRGQVSDADGEDV